MKAFLVPLMLPLLFLNSTAEAGFFHRGCGGGGCRILLRHCGNHCAPAHYNNNCNYQNDSCQTTLALAPQATVAYAPRQDGIRISKKHTNKAGGYHIQMKGVTISIEIEIDCLGPDHPIYIDPPHPDNTLPGDLPHPEHPIVIPPGETPNPPIIDPNPPRPDNTLPGDLPHPDNTLPIPEPKPPIVNPNPPRPDNTLPGDLPHPDNTLPIPQPPLPTPPIPTTPVQVEAWVIDIRAIILKAINDGLTQEQIRALLLKKISEGQPVINPLRKAPTPARQPTRRR